ncbi:MAG: hypothetical protein KDA81_13120 [Planctomycetaceae bacterium]|nr:hypothetical protein [Planctomycetaceae bacterium]
MTSSNKATQAALTLTLSIAIGWVVCFWPARMLGGQSGVLWMSVAAVCCLIPGWIVVFLSGLAIFPNDLSVMVISTMVRLCSVAGAAVLVRKLKPELTFQDFFGWLIGFYLLALVAEVRLLRPPSHADVKADNSSSSSDSSRDCC